MSNLPAGLVVMTAVMVPPGSKTCRRDERSEIAGVTGQNFLAAGALKRGGTRGTGETWYPLACWRSFSPMALPAQKAKLPKYITWT